MGALGKFLSHLKAGRLDLIGRAINERTPWWVRHKGKAFLYQLKSSDQSTPAKGSALPHGYECRYATREEMPACSQITGIDVAEYYRRFDAGDVCYGVFRGGGPVNINWVHSGACFVRGMGYSLEASSRDKYVYGIMTDPAERGKGLYKSCLVELAGHLFENGAERIIQMVEDGNTPVLTTLPQLGYERTHEIRHRRLLGIKRTWVLDLTSGDSWVRWFVVTPTDRFVI